jgi:hypothetical protein
MKQRRRVFKDHRISKSDQLVRFFFMSRMHALGNCCLDSQSAIVVFFAKQFTFRPIKQNDGYAVNFGKLHEISPVKNCRT